MDLVTRWPPELYKEKIFFCFSDLNNLLLKPALCAHSVLLLSKGTATFTGWKASNAEDSRRTKEVPVYYGSGVGKGTLNDLRTAPKNKRVDVILAVNQTRPSDMCFFKSTAPERYLGG